MITTNADARTNKTSDDSLDSIINDSNMDPNNLKSFNGSCAQIVKTYSELLKQSVAKIKGEDYLEDLDDKCHTLSNSIGILNLICQGISSPCAQIVFQSTDTLTKMLRSYMMLEPTILKDDVAEKMTKQDVVKYYQTQMRNLESIKNQLLDEKFFLNKLNNLLKKYKRALTPKVSDLKSRLSKEREAFIPVLERFSEDFEQTRKQVIEAKGSVGKSYLPEIISSVKKAYQSSLEASNLNLEIEVQQIFIETNKYILKKILGNYVENAIKYSRQEGESTEKKKTITIKTEQTNSGLAILVEDEGIGIPQELRTNLFKKKQLEQSERVRKDIYRSGKGLQLIHRNSKKIGAKTVYEPLSNGSRFGITFSN